MVVSPCTTFTLPLKVATLSLSRTSSRERFDLHRLTAILLKALQRVRRVVGAGLRRRATRDICREPKRRNECRIVFALSSLMASPPAGCADLSRLSRFITTPPMKRTISPDFSTSSRSAFSVESCVNTCDRLVGHNLAVGGVDDGFIEMHLEAGRRSER